MEVGTVDGNKWIFPRLFSLTKTGKYTYFQPELSVFRHSGRQHKITQKMIDNVIEEKYPYYVEIITRSGFVDGKEQVSEPTVVEEGKNIGKKNETNPFVQAYKMALSQYNYKQNRCGFKPDMTIDKSVEKRPFPMLLRQWSDVEHKFGDDVFVQKKYNGIRAVAYVHDGAVTLYSRTHTEFTGFVEIEQEVKKILDHTGYYLDGELYNHSMNLQEINGAVRGSDVELKRLVKYVVFDVFKIGWRAPFSERYEVMCKLLSGAWERVELADTVRCSVVDCVSVEYKRALDEGYEGVVVRNPDAPYGMSFTRPLRVDYVAKIKPEFDNEFPIVGAKTGKRGKFVGQIIFILDACGVEFNATPNWTEAQSREAWEKYLKDSSVYVGKFATVKYSELSEGGVPQQPKVIAIRDYE